MKLSVRISPVLRFRTARQPEPDLTAVAFTLNRAGVASLEVDALTEPSNDLLRELQRMRETVDLPLGIRVLPVRETVQRFLELHPERVTLCDISANDPIQPISLNDEKYDLPEIVKMIREQGSECIVKIRPDLSELKRAAKIRCFGVEMDTRDWRSLHGPDRRTIQGSWRDAALAAWKLGLTIWCDTALHTETLSVLRAIPELEGLVIGDDFWAKAMLFGVEETVMGIRNAI